MLLEEILKSLSKDAFDKAKVFYDFGFKQGSEIGFANFNALRMLFLEEGFSDEKSKELLQLFAEGFLEGQEKRTLNDNS